VTLLGIFRNRVWHAVSSFVVKDTLQELVLAVIPGTNCMVEENYPKSHKDGKRRWDFKDKDWLLEEFTWHTNRMLTITESEKYYSIMLFWNQARNEFLGYYVNFQLPFQRSHCGINSLDLDLDIVIEPDLSFRWKDEDDYQKAIEQGIIIPEWVQNIENAKPEIMERLEKRQYPFDGSWLGWEPDPTWSPPTLPENWDKI
jgi:predicted RNA-binding protein associated with RNAse of E/G family